MQQIRVPARRLEELLETEIHSFELQEDSHSNKFGGRRRILRAAGSIAVPGDIEPLISFLSVNAHPLALRALAEASTESAVAHVVDGSNTLEIIRRTYDIPDDLVVTNASNTQCVPSFYDEAWNPTDLELFFTHSLPDDELPTVIAKGDRENDPERASTEASLDIQYITGTARNATTYMWTMNGSNPYSAEDEPFVEFAEAVLAMDDPPLVISISYSDDEEHIFNVADSYARTLDTLLVKMGLRGISVLVASGDDGVTGLRPQFEKVPREDMCQQSGPQWPSSSPYITTVGATMQLHASDFGAPFFSTSEEVICSSEVGGIITTGGGFSNVYPMPDYQREQVDAYLSKARIPTTPGFFNASGRAYPDISALGASFMVYINGRMTAVSGTSASTPVLGGMVTLWNDIRLNAGKSPLGFLNPLLYYLVKAKPRAFHDVVVGNNGAPRGGDICADSFGAAAGWDAVSGVGTPNFPVIADFIRDLDDHFDVDSLGAVDTACSKSTATNNQTASAEEEESDGDGGSSTAFALLIVAIVGNVLIAGLMLFGMYKRWRNQYTPLGGDAAAAKRDTAIATSPLRRESAGDSTDRDAGDEVEVELSEISLHD